MHRPVLLCILPARVVRVDVESGRVPTVDDARLVELRQFPRGVCRTRGEAFIGGRRVVRANLTTVLRAVPASGVATIG